MSDTQPTPRAEFEALLARYIDVRRLRATAERAGDGLSTIELLCDESDLETMIAEHVMKHWPYDNAAPDALPDDWQPSPELGD